MITDASVYIFGFYLSSFWVWFCFSSFPIFLYFILLNFTEFFSSFSHSFFVRFGLGQHTLYFYSFPFNSMKSHVPPCVYAPPEDCNDYNAVIMFLPPRATGLIIFQYLCPTFVVVVTLPPCIHHYQWCLFYAVNICWDLFAFLPFYYLTISFCMSDFPSGIIFLLLGLHNLQISFCDQHCLNLSINVISLFLEGYFTGYKILG